MAAKIKKLREIERLKEEAKAARVGITASKDRLTNQFAVVERTKDALTSKPAIVVAGSLVGGFLLKRILPSGARRVRKKSSAQKVDRIQSLKKERGFLVGLIGLLIALAKPAAKLYATKLVKDYFAGRRALDIEQGRRIS